MTPNENSVFFLQPRRTPRTEGSWWTDKPRAGFTDEGWKRVMPMSNSPEARHTSSIIVGHTGRTR